MSEQPYTVFTAMTDIVAAPGKALDEIKNHTAWLWWPLLINVGLAVAATVYYAYWRHHSRRQSGRPGSD